MLSGVAQARPEKSVSISDNLYCLAFDTDPAPVRSSPEHINFLAQERAFCPFENCPADNFLSGAQGYAPLASSITRCFDRLRLNRRLLRVSAITARPNCQC